MDTTIILLAIISSGLLSTLLTIIIGWKKDIWEEEKQERKRLFKIREDAYREVMKNIDFIYKGIDLTPEEIAKKKYRFLENYRLMFLYSEDEIIEEINNVLDVLSSFWPKDDEEMEEKKNKIARSMIILRKQIVVDTKLTEKDFKHII
ncbi:hypothetical protein KKG29_04840 [Patescibacteria group bacterium]|nr:hypothetical protein [Patescibacteria group bacterium]MBU4000463.1 hypothetical protein [Patescibacteria group bacterium]MBU4056644.1 hypothetical protein [Patescibacteria group bacterium]MBU4368329.1 hypothetical protein [Patescibacteria group bacterium]